MKKINEDELDFEKQKNPNTFKWSYALFILLFILVTGYFLSSVISVFSGDSADSSSGNVALIPIEGEILASSDSSSFFQNGADSSTIIELIEKADKNPNVKAIIFEINSPGGSAVASAEIADAIKKTNKTTVAWIREEGASGAYWIASSTNHIVANRASITGSIGVIASYLEFPGLLSRYNVTYERLVSGKYKDMGTPFRELTGDEKAIMQQSLDSIRDYFVTEVAKNRNMNKKDVEKIANGLFYIGAQAKDLGLVDELGGKGEAVKYIEKKEGITAEISEYKKEKTLFDVLSKVMGEQSFEVGRGIGNSLVNQKASSKVSITT